MKNSEDSEKTMCNQFELSSEYRSRPTIAVDYDRYLHYLDDCGLDETKKREFIDALWSIIISFVDLGFGVHPLQQVIEQEDGKYDYLLTPDAKNMLRQGSPSDDAIPLINKKPGNTNKERIHG